VGLMLGHFYPCMECLQEDCMAVGLDKRGGLYVRCQRCGTIKFYYSDIALNGLRHVWGVALTIDEIKKRVGANQALPVSRPTVVRA